MYNFSLMHPSLTPRKHQKTVTFSDVFMVVEKECVGKQKIKENNLEIPKAHKTTSQNTKLNMVLVFLNIEVDYIFVYSLHMQKYQKQSFTFVP